MNQIAREAGVTKLTVYNHFQDKATLFSCAIEDTCEAILHEHPQLLQPSSDFVQEFYQACQRALNIIHLPEAIKLDLLLMELASQQSPLAEQFYQASHSKLDAVWNDFYPGPAIPLYSDRSSRKTDRADRILADRNPSSENPAGSQPSPSSAEQQQIISEAIELFMLKYALPD